ncbi:SpoIIE family protein phosphatase [Isoptericola sp. NEAU-Y5]|uniref:SpoIIE family protein phosphatase n=1 Tax=Isoptericola luteus TaxID=2879484 RepID=A0ABS7ZII1_9MICO|nr:SpoIIE family protein phosphatase [Isoptericola sp. NEAU-Y5]MCA5894733.1 SpoIIE family protein phosphatase [Isoptericola sp. NEAU-Y5]
MTGDRAAWWATAPAALLRLDLDGHVLDANATFLAWYAGSDGDGDPSPLAVPEPEVLGRRLSDLLSAGGRIYWDTHVMPRLVLAGRVDDVSTRLRTPGGPLPVLLSARRTTGPDGGIDAVLLAAHDREKFERELVAARALTERSAQRLRWVQDATAALSRAAGMQGVVDALLQSVTRHVSVEAAELRAGAVGRNPTPYATPDGRIHVPVGTGEQAHGTLVVTPHRRPGDEELDPDALATIARHGALALDRARLHEQSVSVAYELQHAMLSQDMPQHDGVGLAAAYRPATRGLTVGGDWYDVFMMTRTSVALEVGDVVGHGLPAATTMGQLRTAGRALAAPEAGPATLLNRLDQYVTRHDVGFGATMVHAVLDTTSGTLRYACAGHPPPLLVRADGEVEFLWDGRSAPLGVARDPAGRVEAEIALSPGDAVVLYTDGVAERRDRALRDGLFRLSEAVTRYARDPGLPERLVLDLGNELDDACVLHVTWRGHPPAGPGRPTSAKPAHRDDR